MRVILVYPIVLLVASLAIGFPNSAGAVETKTKSGPSEVLELFWKKIKSGDVEGAMALHTFSSKTERHRKGLQAEFTKWAKNPKTQQVRFSIAGAKVDGNAAVVMTIWDEGMPRPSLDPIYLVRKNMTWKMLILFIAGDASVHELDAETVASMKKLKTWATEQRNK